MYTDLRSVNPRAGQQAGRLYLFAYPYIPRSDPVDSPQTFKCALQGADISEKDFSVLSLIEMTHDV